MQTVAYKGLTIWECMIRFLQKDLEADDVQRIVSTAHSQHTIIQIVRYMIFYLKRY